MEKSQRMRSIFRTLQFINRHPLASHARTTALGHWVRWQLGARLLQRPVLMPFVGDAVLVVELGMFGATGNIYCGLHEFADMSLALHFLRPGDRFLDVGANVGTYSVLASKVAGADVTAIEPVPATFARLKRNVNVNEIGNRVNLHMAAVGAQEGSLEFSIDQDTTNHVVGRDYPGKSIHVPVVTIDGVLQHHRAIMWKVDVEGFEREVLMGAVDSLADPGLQIVILEGDDLVIAEMMKGGGFSRFIYEPFQRAFRACGAKEAVNNHLWIRDLAQVQARCQMAPVYSVLGVKF